MSPLDELALLLRPAGGGVYRVSTGRAAQEALQMRLYGAASTADVERRWREALAGVAVARAAILAVPSDCGAGLVRGANLGPQALRTALLDLEPDFPEACRKAGVVDVGDVLVVPQLLHDEMLSDAQLALTRRALYPGLDAAATRALPVSPLSMAEHALDILFTLNPDLRIVLLGGDHSVAWPVVAALARRTREPWAIVQPDAHTDLLPERLGVKYCFATWAHHANELLGRGGRLVQVGIRASNRPKEHWESTLGVKQIWAAEVRERGEEAAIEEIVAHLRKVGARRVYVSNDIDGTDSSIAPSTGAPEPEGLRPELVRALITRVGAELPLLGGDVVEVAPSIGSAAEVSRTVEVGASYVLATLRALGIGF